MAQTAKEELKLEERIVDLVSALNSLTSVSLEGVELVSEFRSPISNDRVRRLTPDSSCVDVQHIELAALYSPDSLWVDKSAEWKKQALLAIMLSVRKELKSRDDECRVAVSCEKSPFFLQIVLPDVMCEGKIRRRLVADVKFFVKRNLPTTWKTNARWIPNPDTHVALGAWDAKTQSYDEYLDEALENERAELRYRHYLPKLVQAFEIWRHRCPSLLDGVRRIYEWLNSLGLLPVPHEWILSMTICALVQYNAPWKGPYEIPSKFLADGPTDKRKPPKIDYTVYGDVSADEIWLRFVRLLTEIRSDKVLMMPLTEDTFVPHNPETPMTDPEPHCYFDYITVASRAWATNANICETLPEPLLIASFDPRGLLIASPEKWRTQRIIAAAKKHRKGGSSKTSDSNVSDVQHIIELKPLKSLNAKVKPTILLKYKNVQNMKGNWENDVPDYLDSQVVLTDAIHELLCALARMTATEYNAHLLYKISQPYPNALAIAAKAPMPALVQAIIAILSHDLVEDTLDSAAGDSFTAARDQLF